MAKTASRKVTIQNRLGLHARPAMIFVEAASKYASKITVSRTDQEETVDGKSIMQMMMLAATEGTQIEITATGHDAEDAVAALVALVESRFTED